MDYMVYLRFVLALLFVLGLIGGAAVLLRRFAPVGVIARRGADRRLRLVEMLAVDARHRLVLVRRDDREHLLLLGPEGSAVIETGIEAPITSSPLETPVR